MNYLEVTSSLEDIISKYSKNPSMLYEELKKFLAGYDKEELKSCLHSDGDLFGESKITQYVLDILDGKTVSPSVISSFDFSEDVDEFDDGKEPTDEEAAINKIKYDVKKMKEPINCPLTEEHFRVLLMEPMLVSDWSTNKFEMVKDFNYPDLTLDADGIVNSGMMDALCSPVTVSLMNECKLQDSEILTDDNPISRMANAASSYYPTLDDYVNDISGTLGDQSVVDELAEQADAVCNTPVEVGFSIFDKIKTSRGLQYLLNLISRRQPTKAVIEKSFSAEEAGISALAQLASTVDMKDISNPRREKEIPTGDTAQKRGGSSAPRSQGGGGR